MANKRKYERFHEKLKIKYEVLVSSSIEDSEAFKANTYLLNISEGGILFSNSSPISISSSLKIQIYVPWKNSPIVLIGDVVRVKEITPDEKYEIAFSFKNTHIFENERKLLLEHLKGFE